MIMRGKRGGKVNKLKKILASILCINILLSSSPLMLFAADTSTTTPIETNITGVTGNNGVYDITATSVSDGTGYRQYTNFALANTDTANLIFTYNDADFQRFINMVDNKVEINGLLNSVNGKGAFYNGHVIFVTKSGMVIGADGVLNVGKLSMVSTNSSSYNQYVNNHSQANYDALITNASGDIIINGKIMTSVPGPEEKAAEIYANKITVEKKSDKAENTTTESVGIIANTDTEDTRVYSNRDAAATKFNSLVNAQVKTATASAVDADGTVILTNTKMDAKDTVTINNEAVYGATMYKKVEDEYVLVDFKTGEEKKDNTDSDTIRKVETTVLLDNTDISGKEVNITATSTATGEANLRNGTGSSWSVIWDRLLDDLLDENSEINSLFSATGYTYFVGSRSKSEINIKNSSITTKSGDINVSTNATAKFKLDNTIPKPKTEEEQKAAAVKDFLFTFGTETKSKITIDNSTVEAKGNTKVESNSSNSFLRKDESLAGTLRTGGLLTFGKKNTSEAVPEGIFNFSYFSFTTDADTGVVVENGSTVKGARTDINSTANVKNDIWIDNVDTIGTTTEETDDNGNGAVVAVIVNNADIKNSVTVEDSTVEATSGDLSINVNSDEAITTKNLVRTTAADIKKPTDVDKEEQEEPEQNNSNSNLLTANAPSNTDQQSSSNDSSSGPLDYFKKLYKENKVKVQELVTGLINKAGNKAVEYLQTKLKDVLPKNSFKFGGVATLNSAVNKQGITITNSTLKASQNLVVNSYLNFVHSNIAIGDAEKGEVNTVGIGAAFVYDNIDNDNLITVSGSELTAGKDLSVDALTKMPGAGEKGTIEFSPVKELIKLQIDFDVANMKIEKPTIKTKKFKDWLKKDTIKAKNWSPVLTVTGLFENQVASFSKSKDSTVDVAVSALVAKSDNNTKVDILNSTLTANSGNVAVKAANSVQSYNALGIRELILTKDTKKSLTDLFNTDGLGGDVYYRDSNSEAVVNIDKSTVTASNGDVNISSENDRLYINLLKLGAKGNELASVTGSVNIQNFGGTTEVTVSGIQDEESAITGKNVAVSSEDGITAIDVNGAYSSSGGGVAVGAAVNVWNIDRDVKAVVDHATITSTEGNTTVNASADDNIIEFAIAGAYSGNGAEDVAGSEDSTIRNSTTKADNASSNRESVSVENDDAGVGEEGAAPAADAESAVDEIGVSGHRQQFSLSGAGSVNVVIDKTDVIADVRNSTIDSNGTTAVNASADNLAVLGAGGISASTQVGAGAAANLYLRDSKGSDVTPYSVRASVEDSTLTSGGAVSVKANDTTDVYSFAAGVGIVSEDPDNNNSTSVTLGGSFDYNSVRPAVDAHIADSTVEGKSESKKADVSVDAEASTFTLSISGGVGVDTTPGLSIGASVAATADSMGSLIKSYISGSTLNTNIGNVSVLSKAGNTTYGIGVSSSVTTKSSTDFKFDGSLGIVFFTNDIRSYIKNSNVNANGGVEVFADNASDAVNLEGTVEFSGSSDTGVGVNGAVVIDKQGNNVSSSISNSSSTSVSASEDIKVLANSYEQLNAVPITASIAKSGIESLSNVVVNLIDNNVKADVQGTLTSGKDVSINANDETYLLTRGGTAGIDMGSGSASPDVVMDFSVNYNKIAKTVNSTVRGATLTADGDLTVKATSVDAIGASDGKKDEDQLLNKDSDNYYSSLKVDKDFSKWNMFYNLGASMSSGVTASGAVIVDNVKNNVNASIGAEWYDGWSSINKSVINARNVNVFAFDTGINNVFAGTIAGTVGQQYAGSLGFNVIWARNASTVSATIMQNSEVSADGKTSVDARSDKDTNLVLVAASGNTGKGLSLAANGIYNRNKDDVFAGVDYSIVEAGSLDINADNTEDIVKVMVGATGSETVALSVEPIVDKQVSKVRSFINIANVDSIAENYYFYLDPYQKSYLFSKIDNKYYSSVLTNEGGIAVNANNKVNTTDVVVSITGAQYVAGGGLGIGHTFSDYTVSRITAAIINSAGGLESSAVNTLDVDNWSMGVAAALQGAAGSANAIKNDVKTTSSAQLTANDITTAGDIKVNINLDENVANTTAALQGTYQGASLGLNLIFNFFKENSEIEVMSNSFHLEDREVSVSVKALHDRVLANRTILADLNLMGGAAGGAAVKTKNSAYTEILFDNGIETKGDVEVGAEDTTKVSDTSVNVAAGAAGAGIGVNVFLFTNKGSTFVTLKNSVTARNVIVNSRIRESYDQVNVGVETGAGVIAVNVAKIKMGNTPVPTFTDTDIYTQYEKTATKQLHDRYGYEPGYIDDEVIPNPNVLLAPGSNVIVGAMNNPSIPSQNSIDVSGDLKVSSESIVDGINLTNVNVSASLGGVGVGVHSVDLQHSTVAMLLGATVKAGGNVEVSASHKDNTNLTSVGVDVSVAKVGVGANSYNNESNTQAIINSATVKATDGSVSVLSSTDTNASANNVGISVSGAEVNVLHHSLTDTAKASSLIVGKTAVDADTLNVIASGAMDLSGGSTAVRVSGADVDVQSNKVEGNAEISALITDSDDTTLFPTDISISAKNLNIVSDYSKMKVSAKNNIVAVSLGEVSVYNDNAYLHPVFNSGINSTTGTVSIGTGTTLIETAKPTDGDNEFMLSTSKIGGVSISVLKPYGGTTAKAKIDAQSNSFVVASNNRADNLIINAYLKTKDKATADSDNFSVAGVDYVSAEGTNKSTLNITTGGTSTVTNKIQFNTQNVAISDVDLNDISASLIGEVSVLRLNSTMNAKTTTNLSGTLKAAEIEGNFNTDRTGKYSTSYHGGSAVHVNSTGVKNEINGANDIRLEDLTMVANRISFNDISVNTADETSKSSSGGLIDVGKADYKTDYDPVAKITLDNVTINPDAAKTSDSASFNVDNKLIIKVQSKSSGGGLISVKKSNFSQTFKASSNLVVTDSDTTDTKVTNIKTGDFNLSATSNISTATNDQIQYTSTDDGFITVSGLKIKTYLKQYNTITIDGASKINALNNINMKTASDFYFRQYGSIKDDGFSSWPNVNTELTSDNFNTINVNGKSVVSADNELTIAFDVSGDLYTKSFSKARNFGSKVKSNADVTLNVDNKLNVGDEGNRSSEEDFKENILHGGNYVGVSFMGNSSSNVDHESYAQCNAVAPDTSQNGTSKKTVNNTFNLYSNGSLETNRDIEVNFALGDGSVTSWNHYKRVYYVAFGYTKTKSYRHNVETNHNPVFNMFGALSAGFSENWILEIDANENIVNSVGFRSSSYEFIDAADAQDLKNQKLVKIKSEIESLKITIALLQALRVKTMEDLIEAITDYQILGNLQTAVDEQDIPSGHILPLEEVRKQISEDLMDLVVDKYEELGGDAETAATLCNQLIAAYEAAGDSIWNYDEMEDFVNEQISDEKFLSAYNYSTKEFENRFSSVVLNDSDTEDGLQFISYSNGTAGGWFLGFNGTNITDDLATAKAGMEAEYRNYASLLAEYEAELHKKQVEKQDAEQRYAAADLITPEEYEQKYGLYSIVFDDIYLTSQGSIKVNGVDVSSSGSPTEDYPASLYPDTNRGTIRIMGPGGDSEARKLQFYVGTGGVQITNYSNRSLMFGDVQVTDNSREDKVVINGTIRNDLIKTPAPILITGITIRNLMDVTHPFYTNDTGHNLKDLNNIVVNGVLLTNATGYPITVTSQSGDVRIASISYVPNTPVTIGAEQGNLIIGGTPNADGDYVFTLDAGNSLVAGKLLRINADIINIGDNATLTAGMIDKQFFMDGDAPQTTKDPVTGRNILLTNADEGTNIKALYVDDVDGRRYELFSLRESDGSVQLVGVKNQGTNPEVNLGTGATITVNHGYSNVRVENNNNINIRIHGIENIRTADSIYPAVVGIDESKVTMNKRDEATVNLNTWDSITIGGKILNSYERDADGNLNRYDGIVSAEPSFTFVQIVNQGETGSIIVDRFSNTEPSISTGGLARIISYNSGDVMIIGGIDSSDIRITQYDESESGSMVDDISTDRLDIYTKNQNVDLDSVEVKVFGNFQTPEKRVVVDNEDITIKSNIGIKLYTSVVGAFSMNMNVSSLVVTDAPAVYSRGDLLIKNLLGYHTFETLSYSEANTMDREAKTVNVKVPSFTESLVAADVKLIEMEED